MNILTLNIITFFSIVDESPRWLLVKGKIDIAVGILQKAWRTNRKEKEDNNKNYLTTRLNTIYKVWLSQYMMFPTL